MSASVDFALVGTGVAPLVAARLLLERGYTVAVVNPDPDFFIEESELPLDPLFLQDSIEVDQRLKDLDPRTVLEALKPAYPGALEVLPRVQASFFDLEAPWVRSRAWTYVGREGDIGALNILANRAKERGAAPIRVTGETLVSRMPGAGTKRDTTVSGVTLPRCGDAEIVGYRRGIADFLKEKLGDLWLNPISRMEVAESGDLIRYWKDGLRGSLAVQEKVLFFVTPNLERLVDPWGTLPSARAHVFWEEWSLVSKDTLDPAAAFLSENMIAYCPSEAEGDLLHVLRRGGSGFAGEESFRDLWFLCRGLLGWERFSIRSLRTRRLLSRGETPYWLAPRKAQARRVLALYPADGALARVVSGVTLRVGELIGDEP